MRRSVYQEAGMVVASESGRVGSYCAMSFPSSIRREDFLERSTRGKSERRKFPNARTLGGVQDTSPMLRALPPIAIALLATSCGRPPTMTADPGPPAPVVEYLTHQEIL